MAPFPQTRATTAPTTPVTTPRPQQRSSGTRNHVPVIVGASVGAFIFLLGLAALVFFILRKRRRRSQRNVEKAPITATIEKPQPVRQQNYLAGHQPTFSEEAAMSPLLAGRLPGSNSPKASIDSIPGGQSRNPSADVAPAHRPLRRTPPRQLRTGQPSRGPLDGPHISPVSPQFFTHLPAIATAAPPPPPPNRVHPNPFHQPEPSTSPTLTNPHGNSPPSDSIPPLTNPHVDDITPSSSSITHDPVIPQPQSAGANPMTNLSPSSVYSHTTSQPHARSTSEDAFVAIPLTSPSTSTPNQTTSSPARGLFRVDTKYISNILKQRIQRSGPVRAFSQSSRASLDSTHESIVPSDVSGPAPLGSLTRSHRRARPKRERAPMAPVVETSDHDGASQKRKSEKATSPLQLTIPDTPLAPPKHSFGQGESTSRSGSPVSPSSLRSRARSPPQPAPQPYHLRPPPPPPSATQPELLTTAFRASLRSDSVDGASAQISRSSLVASSAAEEGLRHYPSVTGSSATYVTAMTRLPEGSSPSLAEAYRRGRADSADTAVKATTTPVNAPRARTASAPSTESLHRLDSASSRARPSPSSSGDTADVARATITRILPPTRPWVSSPGHTPPSTPPLPPLRPPPALRPGTLPPASPPRPGPSASLPLSRPPALSNPLPPPVLRPGSSPRGGRAHLRTSEARRDRSLMEEPRFERIRVPVEGRPASIVDLTKI
jgi:hypothetical protein